MNIGDVLAIEGLDEDTLLDIARQPQHAWPELIRQARFAEALERAENSLEPDYEALVAEDERLDLLVDRYAADQDERARIAGHDNAAGGILDVARPSLPRQSPEDRQALMAALMSGDISIEDADD